MDRTLTIAATMAAALLFGLAVPFLRLFDAFPPMITALSIMIAAVFVRLNRGMPTLEWKSVDPGERRRLTSRIVELSVEYARILGIVAATLLALVTVTVIGKTEIGACWPALLQQIASGSVGGVGTLCVARMVYVVWRDIDVTRLQASLVNAIGDQQSAEEQARRADKTVASIRAAGLRKIDIAPPKAWGE